VRITFAVALTTLTGYLLAKGRFDSDMILPVIGIFILACGSAALNHYQESEKDAKMERTKNRPIPSGKISSNHALLYSAALIILGSWIIYAGSGFLAMQLGLLALIWYNGFYTPLKKRTSFAVIPGAIIGAIPPMVGWVAGGESLVDLRAAIIAFFFFIWQVPHFWLLLLKYGKEYEKAGFPSLTSKYSERQIKYTTFIWTLSTAISALMFPVFGIINSSILSLGMLLIVLWLIFIFTTLLRSSQQKFNPVYYFMKINYFVLMVMVFLSMDSVL